MNNPQSIIPNHNPFSSMLSLHEAEIRKAFLIQKLSNSSNESMELFQLSHLSLLNSGIYEVSTAENSYKVAIFKEEERLLGGAGLEDVAMKVAEKLINSGIQILFYGNQKEMIECARKDKVVKAEIKIGETVQQGTYSGPMIVGRKKYRFLCCCPVYCIMATGKGVFQSREVTYQGNFQNNLFDDNTGEALLNIGSGLPFILIVLFLSFLFQRVNRQIQGLF